MNPGAGSCTRRFLGTGGRGGGGRGAKERLPRFAPDEDELALPLTVWYLRQPLGIKVQSYDDPTNDCSSGSDTQGGLGFVLCMRHKRL